MEKISTSVLWNNYYMKIRLEIRVSLFCSEINVLKFIVKMFSSMIFRLAKFTLLSAIPIMEPTTKIWESFLDFKHV